MDTERVIDVIERLYRDHDIRLLGLDCSLSFLMELPASRWRAVVDHQLATITNTLGGLLPDDVRQITPWSDVTTYDDDVDLRFGRPLTVCVDPMTATPTKLFTLSPREPDDQHKPKISSIARLQDGTLIAMTDWGNKKVNLVDVNTPHAVAASVTLDEKPLCLSALSDGSLAVTASNKSLFCLHVVGTRQITLHSKVKTPRQYWGICDNADGNITVSCIKDVDGPASVDVITRSGVVVKTLINSHTLPLLTEPSYLFPVNNHLLVSDYMADTVFRVDTDSGDVLDQLTHPDLLGQSQLCADVAGNVYVASGNGSCACVMVKSCHGEWRRLLEAQRHSEEGYAYPVGVCVTSSCLFGLWLKKEGPEFPKFSSVLIGYRLQKST
jgi:hypothetical protein